MNVWAGQALPVLLIRSLTISVQMGRLVLWGVTEELAPVNTRMILEKGLTVKRQQQERQKRL